MKVVVHKDECIGCGNCEAICPEVFKLNSEGIAEVIMDEIPKELTDSVYEAIESCPTSAIVEE